MGADRDGGGGPWLVSEGSSAGGPRQGTNRCPRQDSQQMGTGVTCGNVVDVVSIELSMSLK
jgi:hypothetical protein